jgi:hypothetical protein
MNLNMEDDVEPSEHRPAGHFRSSRESKSPTRFCVGLTTLMYAIPSRSRTASSSVLNADRAASSENSVDFDGQGGHSQRP